MARKCGRLGIPSIGASSSLLVPTANLCNARHGDLQTSAPSTYKLVTSAVHCENEARFFRLGLDFLAQMDNMRINRAGSGKSVIAPDFLKQAISAQGFSLMAKKVFEQLEFLGRKIQLFSGARDLATAQIHFNVTERNPLLFFGYSPRPAQHGLHPGKQLANGKRLGHVVVGAQFESHDFIYFLAPRSQHYDGDRRPLALKLLANV